jgi:NADH-dependent peroxiredoxin subunit F
MLLTESLKNQVRTHLTHLRHAVTLAAVLDEGERSDDLRTLLQDLATLSPLVRVTERMPAEGERCPQVALARDGEEARVRFAGLPSGHEFSSFILALLHTGGHPVRLDATQAAQIQALDGPLDFVTYVSLTCQNCPEVVQALNLLATLNPAITHTMVDGAWFAEEVERRGVMAVPSVFLNGQSFGQGRMTVAEFLAKLDTGHAERTAAGLRERDPYDILIVGGGPAATTAAIYAARKGLRTGLVAERLGGQVLDTQAIENFISVPHTEGPRLAQDLETHVRAHEVDVLAPHQAQGLTIAGEGEAPVAIRLAQGGDLRARTVILATGARWRNMNVPGEADYRNKGVTYCPHCDGPLFKGKRVAVIGGGNSGVEAAIDLAGIVQHVTLLEFDPQLRADAVLQRKLRSLANVTVLTQARTTAVIGDGQKVTGLTYEDRSDHTTHTVALEGVFVQIGLVPNTEWLADSGVARTPRGEIEVDDHGRTSVAGVFAAGDCTTVPFKQIVVAVGQGATASLSAFEHLIRTSAPA